MRDQPTSPTGNAASGPPNARLRIGLSERLLVLTVFFVMVAEILIYLPSVANFRNTWLQDRLSQARTAALVLEAAPEGAIPEGLVNELLNSIQTNMIVLKIGGTRRLLALSDMPPPVDLEIDLRQDFPFSSIMSSCDTLFFGGTRVMRVIGPAPMGGDFVEVVMPEAPMREAMLRFSTNILLLSIAISAITAGLVYAALSWLIVRPVKRMAASILRFADAPEDPAQIIAPSGRGDEIGDAERALAGMQHALHRHLQQREHLAALGLAVAKINHDLRNMLASAQLFTDRIGALADANVQRFAPKLLQALDRAVTFCESVLAYGRASEPAPNRRRFDLAVLVGEVGDLLGLDDNGAVRFESAVPGPFWMKGDPDQLLRVLHNLGRNALVAIERSGQAGGKITMAARRTGQEVVIDVSDDGPGVPESVRATLFRAFSGAGQRGSTGLGLAIAADLVRNHGGTIALCPESECGPGATFRLVLPDA